MTNWHVGQEICCIDASGTDRYCPKNYRITSFDMDGLKEREIYTIRNIYMLGGVIHVRLNEIIRSGTQRWGGPPVESGFAAARFRPIVKTDISIFQAMLQPINHNAREKV